jgi:hypothetical protein
MVTTLEPISCEEQKVPVRADEERIPLSALPKLVWAGGALFAMNLLIGMGMFMTSNLEIDPFGKEVQSYDAASSKISPFTETVDTKKRKVRTAAKLTPATFVPAPQDEFLASNGTPVEYTSGWSRATELEREASRSRELTLPRSSRAYQELDLPVRTERAVYSPDSATKTYSAVDAVTRPASHKDNVVIN